jgi:hypothetical protein
MSTFDDFFSHEAIIPYHENEHLLERLGGLLFDMLRTLNHETNWELKNNKMWKNMKKFQKCWILFEISKFKNSFLENRKHWSWNFDFWVTNTNSKLNIYKNTWNQNFSFLAFNKRVDLFWNIKISFLKFSICYMIQGPHHFKNLAT